MEVPEVKSVGRRTGRAELDEHAEGIHVSRARGRSASRRRARRPRSSPISASRLAVLPLSVNVGQPISHRLDHMLSGVRAEIALKIFGDDLDTMRTTAEELAQQARRNSRASPTCRSRSRCCIPQLEIRVDYGRAALYGVQPAAVIDQLSRLSNGRVISRVIDGYRRFDVVMRLPDRLRTTQGLGDLLIETPSGWIPARQIAEIRETDGPNQILRENGRRRARGARQQRRHAPTWRSSSSGSAAMLAATKLPEGTFASLEGTFQAQEQAARTIGLLSLVSLLLIFAILYSRYRSAVLALIIMGSVPLALIGSVAALVARRPAAVGRLA